MIKPLVITALLLCVAQTSQGQTESYDLSRIPEGNPWKVVNRGAIRQPEIGVHGGSNCHGA